MKRPRSTSPVTPPPSREPVPEPDPDALTRHRLATVVAMLIATLDTMESAQKAGPAARARRSALRSQGEVAAEIGGAEAMETALRHVVEADPSRAESRTRLIREAWSALPGWRDPPPAEPAEPGSP